MRIGQVAAYMLAAILQMGPGSAAAEADRPAFYELAASSAEAVQYELGRKLATELLANATGLDAPTAALARRAAEQLALAKFHVAADAEADRQCAQVAASLFVLQTVPNTIFICADTRWHIQHEPGSVTEVLAQGFIHEGVHLAGMTDECVATLLELEVTGNSIGVTGLANFRKYSGQCDGFRDAQRFRRHRRSARHAFGRP